GAWQSSRRWSSAGAAGRAPGARAWRGSSAVSDVGIPEPAHRLELGAGAVPGQVFEAGGGGEMGRRPQAPPDLVERREDGLARLQPRVPRVDEAERERLAGPPLADHAAEGWRVGEVQVQQVDRELLQV